MDRTTYLKLFNSSLFLSTHRIKKIFSLFKCLTHSLLSHGHLLGPHCLRILCYVRAVPSFLLPHMDCSAALHSCVFTCLVCLLPFSSNCFHLPLSLFLHFASTSMEKEFWKQISLISLLVCHESCMGGKGVAFLGFVPPKLFCISLSKGLKGPPFYIAGSRLTRNADCFIL